MFTRFLKFFPRFNLFCIFISINKNNFTIKSIPEYYDLLSHISVPLNFAWLKFYQHDIIHKA